MAANRIEEAAAAHHAERLPQPDTKSRVTLVAGLVVFGVVLGVLTGCARNEDSTGSATTQIVRRDEPRILAASSAGPSDTQWIERHQPQAKVAVVFVHGITGDALGTWVNPNGTRFFDLVKNDPDTGPKVDILTFGYPSYVLKNGSLDIREAANRLRGHLQVSGVLSYPRVVFVAHSMGGLVVLRMLLTNRDLLSSVPIIVLYATPQEGAQVADLLHRLTPNEAAAQMRPADGNALLQQLSDDWNSVSLDQRPAVRCAYEKRATKGVVIVPWTSATRFCSGAPIAVDADHIDIVKPDRAQHDSFILLKNTLDTFVLNETVEARLETPDFRQDGKSLVLTISNPTRGRDARLVNAGGSALRYTLEQFPEDGIGVSPGVGPAEIKPHAVDVLKFYVLLGATKSEYQFALTSSVTSPKNVIVRIPSLSAIQERREQVPAEMVSAISAKLASSDSLTRWRMAPSSDWGQVQTEFAGIVRDEIAQRNPELPLSAQWILTSEALNALNWPELAVQALAQAEQSEPAIARVPSIQNVARQTAAQAGGAVSKAAKSSIFEIATIPAAVEKAQYGSLDSIDLNQAAELARKLQGIPALAASGYSLAGDVALMQGKPDIALAEYRSAQAIQSTPSVIERTRASEGELAVLHASGHDSLRLYDEGIAGSVKKELAGALDVPSNDVKVEVYKGVVLLSGFVESKSQKQLAGKVAGEVSSVRQVHNAITIYAPTHIGTKVDDEVLATKVKAALLDTNDVNGERIVVDSRGDVVQLTGFVSGEAERKKALALASKVDGVKRVEDALYVKKE